MRFKALRDDGKPALIFAAHLANWELPAITAAKYGLDSAVLYRRPNVAGIDRWLRMARLIRTSLETNGGVCRSLLQFRYDLADEPEEVSR